MLTLSEEIVLLAIDEHSGSLMLLPERSLDFALSGAMMIELSLRGKIETVDDVFLKVLNRDSTGDKILDEALSLIPNSPHLTIENALARIARKGEAWASKTIDSLIEKNILNKKESHFLWIVRESSLQVKDQTRLEALRSHIRDIIVNENVEPNVREIVLISLMDACKMTFTIFSDGEIEKYANRFEQISKKNPIVRAVSFAISEIENAILEVIAFTGV